MLLVKPCCCRPTVHVYEDKEEIEFSNINQNEPLISEADSINRGSENDISNSLSVVHQIDRTLRKMRDPGHGNSFGEMMIH
jgi:hypothetical protein